ncbi:E3 ubiquitin-protein ligase HUWE1-like isoform X1 [Ornithodoros turicata]|uniref:E3 ubiquitin-protein ligase HUWE1-like isoform X1 n=1 Tax=Ornithodoros turicata TaxID=34597 RepID=UPI003139A330
MKALLLLILQFTALLIEHSFSRHLYNSMEHLTALLSSSNMQVVLGVLNLLYVFSKRSNFITRLNPERRQTLLTRLTYLAENWGGKENGFGLAECCQDLPAHKYPASATTLHFEFYVEPTEHGTKQGGSTNTVSCIHLENVDKIICKNPSQIMEELVETYSVPASKQMLLLTHVRLAHSFSNYSKRLQCVQARLQALSILVYCSAIQENVNSLLYNGLIEELVDVLELKDPSLIQIKAAALRTLTSIIHLDRNPKLGAIIDATGAASYHGFLPVLVRSCIQSLTEPGSDPFHLPFATSLFSFLYHLASYESGGEALVSCGMVESLLKVIGWHGTEPEHITFVTRAVRVIDLITGLDMQTFQAHGGLNSFIRRLELEVEHCRQEQPYVIRPRHREPSVEGSSAAQTPMEVDVPGRVAARDPCTELQTEATPVACDEEEPRRGLQCFPQRAALLKSMLNFLKKAIQDPSFADSIRHLMDGSLPRSLKHIISNAEYYGPSLFLLATDVVTVYVFQEPSLLSSLQDNGLTDVVLHALLVKEVPATREVLASLPNVFSALCLNARGLQAFVACRPFERLFKVLLSPDYLGAMRRRRSSDPMGDTASNLGNAMDELMRHQPSLRVDATAAIIKLLEEVCLVGRNPAYVCSKPVSKTETVGGQGSAVGNSGRGSALPNDAGSSDEEEEEDDVDPPTVPSTPKADGSVGKATHGGSQLGASDTPEARVPVPLVDYILNVMRFVDAILSNNSTDDHCREFVQQKGLVPLLGILGLPNLPVDFPVSPACQAVASVCKSILNLAHEPEVLQQGLSHLRTVLGTLDPLHKPLESPGGSVLLEELLASGADATEKAGSSPLLHAMSATHAYIVMFVHVCRTGQSEIRSISMSHWGSELGLCVLRGLSRLYTSLVWESTVLLALCNDAALPPGCPFGRLQLQRLQAMHAAIEAPGDSPMEVDEAENKGSKAKAAVRQIKPLLTGASRLGRALAELFGLLVKLCVGSPMRQRRGQQVPPSPTSPSPSARAVASALTRLLASGLSWEPPLTSPLPKFRLTFYICSVGFTSPMLFDERKYPYHLMLHKFLSSGGQDAFFETFNWALSCGGKVAPSEGMESPELPEGTGEFLDAWLMLLEKMVNPKMVLESPHTLPAGGGPSFDPVLYLIHTHKRAFDAMMQLWDRKPLKVYGDRMSESMLAILCHLLRGEALIKEKLEKEAEPPAASNNTVRPTLPPPGGPTLQEEVNQDHLQQLMDMGFCRELATEALTHSASLEQATDYLLSHPVPPPAVTLQPSSELEGAPSLDLAGMDLEMSEEDQMMRAIAISLGENVLVSQDGSEVKKVEEEREQTPEDPLDPAIIDSFTKRMLPGCLRLLDTLPDTVYRVCDLLVAVATRNGEEWRDNMLAGLLQEVKSSVGVLLEGGELPLEERASRLTTLPEANMAAVRIHLFSLLFEEMRAPCAALMEEHQLVDILVSLMDATYQVLPNKEGVTPKWLVSLVLLIDLYEKASVASKRRGPLLQLSKRQWKWFDDRTGRWNTYTSSNNKAIDDAYCAGEANVHFTAGRRKYTVQFSTMVQINEETGNWRPVMLAWDGKAPVATPVNRGGLTPEQCSTLVRACVGLVGIPVEPDTLHGVLRLLLRLTRCHEAASAFASLGGPRLLLGLTQASAFSGFASLASLLVRHVIEEPHTLAHTMDKVIRTMTSGGSSPMSSKELHYVLRVLGPAACRDAALFCDVATSSLRISLLPTSKRDGEDSRYTGANAVQILKCVPSKPPGNSSVGSLVSQVVSDLLNVLPVKPPQPPEVSNDAATPEAVSEQLSGSQLPNGTAEIVREGSAGDLLEEDVEQGGEAKEATLRGDAPKEDKSQPLLPKSSICRLLAELVRSYAPCAKMVAEHMYTAGQTELVSEDTSALGFVLDHLLPPCQKAGDKDTPALARVLVAALAASNHSPDTQTALVNEVKGSLQRALALPESQEKHVRLQSLASLVGTMIESCPPAQGGPTSSAPSFRQHHSSMNNMVRVLLRRGLVTDLARIPHSLDLSSPHMAATVNAALKPLETLSRMVNLPSQATRGRKNSSRTLLASRDARREDEGVQDGAVESRNAGELSSSEATNAYGEVTVDDNTDSETHVVSEEAAGNDGVDLVGIMDVLLDHQGGTGEASGPDALGDFSFPLFSNNEEGSGTDQAELVLSMDAEDQHDSQHDMEDVHQETTDSESNSESGHSEDDAEQDEEPEEDGDEEDEEDEEGSQFEAEEYQDIEEALFRMQDRDDNLFFHFEEVFPSSGEPGASIMFGGTEGVRTYQLPIVPDEANNGAEASGPSIPPPPGTVASTHPLLVRHGEAGGTGVSSRVHRRPRGYRAGTHGGSAAAAGTWHVYANRHPNPPAILQRLLGPNTAQDILQLTSSFVPVTSSTAQTRVVFANSDFRILATDEDIFEIQDQGTFVSSGGGTGTLANIPTALVRWTEESRVLDGDSMHDCVTGLKPAILEVLEKFRDEELAEWREKRRRSQEQQQPGDTREEQTQEVEGSPTTTALVGLIPDCSMAATTSTPTSTAVTSTPTSAVTSVGGTAWTTTAADTSAPPTSTEPSLAGTERLAASIVERVLGPALSMTSTPQAVRLPPLTSTPPISWLEGLGSTALSAVTTALQQSSSLPSSILSSLSCPMDTSEPAQRRSEDAEQANADPATPAGETVTERPLVESLSTPQPEERESGPAAPGPSAGANDFSSILGGNMEIPEGVDPSFLAALPENIRQEVIAEQLRLQRLRNRAQQAAATTSATLEGTSSFTEVNPEFLAALPPNIQEEVLAQQRAEQQRLAAQNCNPDAPVDPATFIQTLPPGLRQQVLADMDDSLLALLPTDLASEAHNLRRELEARHRQMQERFFSSHGGTALSRILRTAGRVGTRYTIHTVPHHRGQWTWNALSSRGGAGATVSGGTARGRQLLDHEALACLLVLLFVDEPRLNVGRLHRVLRNLCYHPPTRLWVIKSLLSILERTKEQKSSSETAHHHGKKSAKMHVQSDTRLSQPSWLSISLDAALGCRTSVFQIYRQSGSRRPCPQVTIHPQASPIVCRHVLDTLISLAKSFPVHFLPEKVRAGGVGIPSNRTKPPPDRDTDVWSVLVRLDGGSSGGTSKRALRNSVVPPAEEEGTFEGSPLAQLMLLLAHPVLKRSSQLTDRLLRLLALVSLAIPDQVTEPAAPPVPANTTASLDLEGAVLGRATEVPSCSRQDPRSGTPAATVVPQPAPKTPQPSADENQELEKAVLEQHLKLAVEALTSKACSEEGLEDATALLLRLSRGCPSARQVVLRLLMDGARDLGSTVATSIGALLSELRALNTRLAKERRALEESERDAARPAGSNARPAPGTIQDRFTCSPVVIVTRGTTANSRAKGGRELQLPSMAALTSKMSSQAFFLRVLKVVIQLREAVLSSLQKASAPCDQPASTAPVGSTAGIGEGRTAVMDVDGVNRPAAACNSTTSELPPLSEELQLEGLWNTLSDCLRELADTQDQHAVLVLQPAVEAFFLVHAAAPPGPPGARDAARRREYRSESRETQLAHIHQEMAPLSPLPDLQHAADASSSGTEGLPPDVHKFLTFAETHRTVLNQILRQSNSPLAEGPFAVLVDHTRVLDFDVKRRYFRHELERLDEGSRREDLAVHVRREHVFEDSFRELHRRPPEEWKNRFYIVFEGEEGQDAGGLLREWYTIISREIFNPMYALFTTSPGDRVTYMINPSSHCNSNHLSYFKFVGRVIAKAVYDNKLLECYFTRSFYKHILGKPVKYTDMESEDYSFYQGLVFLLENGVRALGYELTFSVEVQEFGVTEVRDLKPGGRHLPVTEETTQEYVRLVCQEKMTGAIRKQLNAFLEGFYEMIPKRLIAIFNEQELELLISGLPSIDVDDLRSHTEYHKYQPNSLQIQWFWRALRSFDQADRAKFLQFVTGTSKVPLQGFAALEGMNGVQKFQIHRDDRSTDRLPSAHTCFNQLDLPAYETYDKLRCMLLKAIQECTEGFGFA